MNSRVKGERYPALDALRGLTLLNMIAYHGMYDLVELYGMENLSDWFWGTPGQTWQQAICWTFILLSGFCWSLGKHPLRRGLTVSVCGLIVTAVTLLFMPSELILFGILTFQGAAMLAMIPLERLLRRIPAEAGLPGAAALFFITRKVNVGYLGFGALTLGSVPDWFYRGNLTAFLGFPGTGFSSEDYFSFIPWFFLYLCGYFLYRLLMSREWVRRGLCIKCAPLECLGRGSLWIYMLHQPVLMAVWMAASWAGIL